MFIRKVEYRTLRSLGDYENETVGAIADVSPGEIPEDVLAALKEWVEGQITDRAKAGELRVDIHSAEERLRQLNFDIERQTKRWKNIQDFVTKLGLKIPVADEEIPF